MAYIYIEKLRHIHFICHKILPLVYDESLSYYEVLCKCVDNINELITQNGEIIDNVDLLNNSVLELNNRVEAVEGEIYGFEERINQDFARLQAEINASVDDKLHEVDLKLVQVDNKIHDVDLKLQDVDERITALEQRLNTEIAEFRSYMESELLRVENEMNAVLNAAIAGLDDRFKKFSRDMQIYVQEEIRKALEKIPEITSVMVKNPVSGLVVPIQQALDDIFIYSSVNAFTIEEKNRLCLSIQEKNTLLNNYLPKGFTIIEWLRDAKLQIVKFMDADRIVNTAYPHSIIYGSYTGNLDWHDKVSRSEWNVLDYANTLSIEEKLSYNCTIDDTIDKGFTIGEFLNKGNLLIAE